MVETGVGCERPFWKLFKQRFVFETDIDQRYELRTLGVVFGSLFRSGDVKSAEGVNGVNRQYLEKHVW